MNQAPIVARTIPTIMSTTANRSRTGTG